MCEEKNPNAVRDAYINEMIEAQYRQAYVLHGFDRETVGEIDFQRLLGMQMRDLEACTLRFMEDCKDEGIKDGQIVLAMLCSALMDYDSVSKENPEQLLHEVESVAKLGKVLMSRMLEKLGIPATDDETDQ